MHLPFWQSRDNKLQPGKSLMENSRGGSRFVRSSWYTCCVRIAADRKLSRYRIRIQLKAVVVGGIQARRMECLGDFVSVGAGQQQGRMPTQAILVILVPIRSPTFLCLFPCIYLATLVEPASSSSRNRLSQRPPQHCCLKGLIPKHHPRMRPRHQVMMFRHTQIPLYPSCKD